MTSRHYNITFGFLRPVFRLINRLSLRFRSMPVQKLQPGQPVLILANHVTNLDPFLISVSFRRPVFWVASDHIFRLGLVSRIITFLVAPIPIVKSRMDLRTLRTISGIIKDGGIVGLFPEGNRCFNGLTGSFPPSTGKLVRSLHAPLMLYRLRGGYLASPRWARSNRKGRVYAELARRLEPDELAALSPDEINRIIQAELAVDAFADQRADPVRFRGKRLAEHLERALFVCPKCHGLDTLRSRDDRFFCTCGLAVRIDEYGFFAPDDPWSAARQAEGAFMDTVAAWDSWQRQAVVGLLDEPGWMDRHLAEPIFTDVQENLVDCERAARSIRVGTGRITLYADRLTFDSDKAGSKVFPLDQLDRITVHGPQVLQFSDNRGQVFELRSPLPRSAYKYVLLCNLLVQKASGDTRTIVGF